MTQGKLLWTYYDRELRYIRRLARDFAQQYPREAGRLGLEADRSTDPHVERMIEAFALLAARVHLKLDDEFPELTDALLGILYPHYLSPVPSMAIVGFDVDPARASLPNGFRIEAGSLLPPPFPPGLRPPPRTVAALCVRLECQAGLSFSEIALDRLRFYLAGESQL